MDNLPKPAHSLAEAPTATAVPSKYLIVFRLGTFYGSS